MKNKTAARPNKQTRPHKKWWVRILRGIGFTVLGVVALCLLLIGTLFVLRHVQSFTLKQQITRDINELSSSSEPSDAQHEATLNLLADKIGLINNPAYSTVSDTCFVDTEGSKYTDNFLYRCMMIYVDVVEMSLPQDIQDEMNRYMTSFGGVVPNEYNRTIRLSNSIQPRLYTYQDQLGDGTSVDLFAKLPYSDTSYEEAAQKTYVTLPGDIKAIQSIAAANNLRRVSQTYHDSMDLKKDYVIVSTRHTYYKKDLGCQIPEIIFCSAPLPTDLSISR